MVWPMASRRLGGARFSGLFLAAALACASLGACGDDDAATPGISPDGDGGGDGATGPVPSEFGLDERPANTTCKAPARPPSSAPVTFERVYENVSLGTPMMMAQAPGDKSRWFVARRNGEITSFPTSNPGNTPTVVANVGTLAGGPVQQGGEGGLLGFAFHPNFAQNGKLYVTWVRGPGNRSEVGVITSTNNGTSFGNYEELLAFDQPASNHNGGGIAFGKDGFLYLSFGDGGGGDDTYVKGQLKTEFFSKVLRIDVDNVPGGQKYGIPDGNPFKNGGGEPATFAWGFRNPFRFSVDRETGEVWVADVGQNKWEEIDLVKAGGNYGWPCKEGSHDYLNNNAQKCPNPSGLIDPVAEHEHLPNNNSRSITGGVVYRGKAIPALAGTYIYGDYKAQELHALSFDPTSGEANITHLNGQAGQPTADWVAFAEDVDGEVYAISLGGQMWKMVAAPVDGGDEPPPFPDRLSKTGCVDPQDAKKPAAGLVPYGVNAELWSDGAAKDRFLALPDGESITVGADGDFDLPAGSVLVKSFRLGGKLVETRLLVRHDDGVWAGYTYEWLDDQSDAVLLPSSKTKRVGTQDWYFPSRADCVRCHTEAAGRSLSVEIGQLNREFVYESTNRVANQLRTFEHIGLFKAPLGKPPAELTVYPDPFGSGPLDARARAYLHANCGNCHRPEGGGRSDMDLRFATPLASAAACNAEPEAGDLGVEGAMRLAPGAPGQSLISLRAHALGSGRMPPLASSVVDEKGLEVVDGWIRSIATCPE
jgi:uncharacterized repeat protein (TIGR03806 family)